MYEHAGEGEGKEWQPMLTSDDHRLERGRKRVCWKYRQHDPGDVQGRHPVENQDVGIDGLCHEGIGQKEPVLEVGP